jgi:uncharacterized integral membrane protein
MSDEFEPTIAEEPASQEPASQEPPAPVFATTGFPWGAVTLLIGVALVVVFMVQNTESVSVEFLWLSGYFSLAIVILVTVGATIVVTEIAGLAYRRRRRRAYLGKKRSRGDTEA